MINSTCGIELEMPVVDLGTGESTAMKYCEHTKFDNGFNLPELSIGPVESLNGLNKRINIKLIKLSNHLRCSGLGLVNFSEHPYVNISPELYHKMCIPRPIYQYWRNIRGWDHSCGIDAKAQMSPSFGVSAKRAVDALNIMIGFASAFIAIYANSPFEGGQVTEYIENRLTLWTRMFEHCNYPSDRNAGQRTVYFTSLKDYFQWIYGDNFIHALPGTYSHYKACGDVYAPVSPVTYDDFFASRGVDAIGIIRGEKRFIEPVVYHQEYYQFSKFTDARIRFVLKDIYRPSEFMNKLDNFDHIAENIYIEMRAPGNNLPDQFIRQTAGDKVADSVVISVCALMKGLLINMDEALKHLPDDFSELKTIAMEMSMANGRLRDFAAKAIEIAHDGLADCDKWMLAYPEYVVDTGLSNGMRGKQDYLAGKSLKDIVLDRVLVV
ncbi:MAG: hypothetical protein KKD44_22300 [Proteobacteria bacterium]|nr:hypothetical protein [Pseudomonadota bacterium]